MLASNIDDTARAFDSLSEPTGEIGSNGIPIVRRSEMMAVPLLESSISPRVRSSSDDRHTDNFITQRNSDHELRAVHRPAVPMQYLDKGIRLSQRYRHDR
jgi:hypothetical protein